MSRCPYWDCGWCYHPGTVREEGCVGSDNCEDYIPMLPVEDDDESTD